MIQLQIVPFFKGRTLTCQIAHSGAHQGTGKWHTRGWGTQAYFCLDTLNQSTFHFILTIENTLIIIIQLDHAHNSVSIQSLKHSINPQH